jgi:formylglycine-generating enzyme required for sulfatase activity
VSENNGESWNYVSTGSFNFAPGTDGRNYHGFVFGNGKFVYPLFDSVRTSTDGLNWTTHSIPNRPPEFWMHSVGLFDQGLFLGVRQTANSTTNKTITTAYSADGINWTFNAATINSTNSGSFGLSGGGHGLLMINSEPQSEVWVSADKGISWKRAHGPWDKEGNAHASFRANSSHFVVATGAGIYSTPVRRNAIGSTAMVAVQGGTLPQGSELAGQAVGTFQIGKYEVTWGEWKEVRDWAVNNGYGDLTGVGQGSGEDHPVEHVSWYDALKWCNAKSQMEGLSPVYSVNGTTYRTGDFGSYGSKVLAQNLSANGYRLPLETEWEWATRGGVSSQRYTYSGGNTPEAVAWFKDNAGGSSRPRGQKGANELGLHDMSGNVWEWVWDEFVASHPSGIRRKRGGGWLSSSSDITVSHRYVHNYPNARYEEMGFRLARNAN